MRACACAAARARMRRSITWTMGCSSRWMGCTAHSWRCRRTWPTWPASSAPPAPRRATSSARSPASPSPPTKPSTGVCMWPFPGLLTQQCKTDHLPVSSWSTKSRAFVVRLPHVPRLLISTYKAINRSVHVLVPGVLTQQCSTEQMSFSHGSKKGIMRRDCHVCGMLRLFIPTHRFFIGIVTLMACCCVALVVLNDAITPFCCAWPMQFRLPLAAP